VRVPSLDVFRGLTMAAMVVVNNPGDWEHVYAPLLHAAWDGWTPTDLIFPFFLFIVGATMTWSRSYASWPRLLRRTMLLIGLGLLLGAFPFFRIETIRIPGVLQRIGLCYFAAGVVLRHWSSPKSLGAIAVALTFGYWALLMWLPPSAGDLSPEGNLGARLDRALVGGRHLWRGSWDPESLLGTLPASATTLLGAMTGALSRSAGSPRRLLTTLLLAGGVEIAIGLAWSLAFPINKNLWSSSYVFFTAGWATIIFAGCWGLIDAWPSRLSRAAAWPFVILGRNAILLYVLSTVMARLLEVVSVGGTPAKTRVYEAWFAPFGTAMQSSLLFAIANLAVLFAVLYECDRRRIFLRL
jgi:predicted acyltransferase